MNTESVSQRQVDVNGFVTIPRNPISRSGVFPYSGRSLPDADPSRIYNVFRPEEELSNPETLNSFKLIPVINDHTMLGHGFETAAEQKGVHGSTGEDVVFENGVLYSTLRIFSDALKGLIDNGKRALSCGYRCVYEKSSGVFNGQAYDYIQRNIRGNHLALVEKARCDVAVLDNFAFDHIDLALEKGEYTMADAEQEPTAGKEEKAEMTMAEASAHLAKILPMLEEMNAAIAALKGAGDAEPALEENATLDEEEEKKKKEKEEMDAAAAKEKEGMDEAVKRIAALEKRTTKEILRDVSERDKLAKEVSTVVGTFDHSEMTADEVAEYAVQKLEISAPKGQERAALAGYLAGRAKSTLGMAMDSTIKSGGKLAARLNQSKA